MSLKNLTRRALLKKSTISGGMLLASSFIANINLTWAYELNSLSSDNMRLLTQLARDIYPHDRVEDRFYVIAVKKFDNPEKASDVQTFLAKLNSEANSQFSKNYIELEENNRVLILEKLEKESFFQTLRADLVTSLYNQKELWPLFGYEGESFSKGGYIYRGFDDINWL